jgi:hypothetical protein
MMMMNDDGQKKVMEGEKRMEGLLQSTYMKIIQEEDCCFSLAYVGSCLLLCSAL